MPLKNNWITFSQWKILQKEGINAHRIFSLPTTWIERYGDDVLISRCEKIDFEAIKNELCDWGKRMGYSPQRIFLRNLVKNPEATQKPALIQGDPHQSLISTVQEYGLNYAIDFGWSYSVGFFIDQRMNRQYLRDLKPKKVLNCFAYTGSFSVIAASAGAETTSVDISKTALQKAKENFDLNGLDAKKHYFIADDVRDVLPRMAKKGRKFDAIILDPPTFSRNKEGKVFNVEKEMEDLIALALQCAEKNAAILVSTNCKSWPQKDLKNMILRALKKEKRNGRLHICPPPPDIPNEAMPRAIWVII
ncbi:MAG: class I SAM-dependent rRNA methyltransferase [Verrucomicrobiota bacterium]